MLPCVALILLLAIQIKSNRGLRQALGEGRRPDLPAIRRTSEDLESPWSMREERGQLSGDIIVYEPFTLWGSVGGNVTVIEGGKLYVRGAIYGDLTVEYGGRVTSTAMSPATCRRARRKVIHSGVLGGDAINHGGRLYVERSQRQGQRKKARRD